MRETRHRADRGLIIQAGLILVLLGLGVVLYFRPASEGLLAARWWHWIVLSLLLFIVAGIGTYRRRKRSHAALHAMIREGGQEES